MKNFVFILLSICITCESFGQINFGIKAGVNVATTKNIIAFPKNSLGCYGGFIFQMPIKKKLFLQSELLYSSKGYKSDDQFGTIYKSVRFNYLNLPILLHYHFDQKTSIMFGPELGYLLSAKLVTEDEKFDITKRYPPRFDIGTSIGLQYRLIKNIGIEIRYIYGFNTFYSTDAVGLRYTDTKGANRVFQIGINYLIPD